MNPTNFVPTTDAQQRAMLQAIGAESVEDLFAAIPAEFQTDAFDLPDSLCEMEMLRELRALAARNSTDLINFCGAGFYDHHIPAAVETLAARGEFFTAYTPYQPEASQGTLQAIYEFQSAIVRLTGMEVANASLYDGGTALFEAMMMALRVTERPLVLVDEGVNPIYRTMLRSYTRNLEIELVEIPTARGASDIAALSAALSERVAALLVQNPNFFGVVEDYTGLVEAAHRVGALVVMSAYPVALSLIKTPGEMGADIAVGEGQSLGLPLAFGGPYLGFMATRRSLVRRMPGRIVGATQDAQGRRGYVLTLQAREQHIRRDKATSNICTNEALCALRALIHLSLLGREGFVELGRVCAANAEYARRRLTAIPGVRLLVDRPVFNELALELPRDAAEVVGRLIDRGIAPGFPVGRYYPGMERVLLTAFTERRTREEIDLLAARLHAAVAPAGGGA
ncbi:MAG: aminomethyl-transferring glycine dehydrogenase subunit GcvPA [Kiritimatiellae bacterium]|nr:aminomethyl-transferring glycine dehydrogenase subunit GcvPA [Kiritimatiellia bacterium]